MGSGKKKKKVKRRTPPRTSPPSNSSLIPGESSLASDSSEESIDTRLDSSVVNPAVSDPASDAHILDLVAQPVISDAELSLSHDAPPPASDAQAMVSPSDLVAQQAETTIVKDCSLNAAASDAQTMDLSLDLVAQLQQNDHTTESMVNAGSTDAPEITRDLADPAKQTAIANGINNQIPAANSKVTDTWCARVKGPIFQEQRNEGFILPSGEVCIKIPNSVIEKHRRSWESFVIGQFYSDPPSQGTIRNIVNGIWSKQYRDIAVSKLEGNAYLFRIPNSATRNRVITQVQWQIEGRTMFVAKWEPGVIPEKPELKSAPIWLELRNVPFQFFNEDGLERIAGMVGHPKFLHPSTANKTNLEVAKVFTIIDPRLPLPEAVNIQFDSGDIYRVLVSSPWMPPICGQCNDIGHNTRSCKKAPKLCASCKSEMHETSNCPKVKPASANGSGKKTRRGRSTSKARNPHVPQGKFSSASAQVYRPKVNSNDVIQGRQSVLEEGGTSNSSQRPEDT